VSLTLPTYLWKILLEQMYFSTMTRILAVNLAMWFAFLALPSTSKATDLSPGQSKKPQLKRRTRLDVLPMLMKSKRWDQAERVANKLMAKHPENPQGIFLAGLIQFQQGRYRQAIPLFKKAGEIQSTLTQLDKYLTICYFTTRQYSLFKSRIERALLQSPVDPELFFFWGRYQASVQGDLNRAVRAFNYALELKPQYIQALYYRGRTFYKQGEKEKAREDFQQSINLIEKTFFREYSYPYQAMANLLLEKSPKQALQFALRSVEIQPQLKNTHFLVGKIYWRLKQLKKAIDALERASFLDPTDSRPYYWLHLLYQHLGKKKDSEMAWLEFRRLTPLQTN